MTESRARGFPAPLVIAMPALLVLIAGCGYTVVAIVSRCHGYFGYSLDDPYIHLALAEQLARGHYGLNAGEASAPASSMLWPFLLAPFARGPLAIWAPLTIALLASIVTVFVVADVLARAYGDSRELRRAAGFLAAAFVPATNMLGLPFTGLEHSLQVMAAVLAMRGMIALEQGERARSLAPSLWLGALVIYAWASCLLGALWLMREPARSFLARARPVVQLAAAGVVLTLALQSSHSSAGSRTACPSAELKRAATTSP